MDERVTRWLIYRGAVTPATKFSRVQQNNQKKNFFCATNSIIFLRKNVPMTLERDDTALKLIDEIIIKKVQPELVECLRDEWVGSHLVKGLFFQNLGYANGKVVQLHQDLERYNLITLKSITFLITMICRLFKMQNVKLNSN